MFRTVFRRLHGRSSDFGIFFNIKLLITGTTKKYNLKRNPRQIVYKRGHQLLAFRIFEFYRALSAISKSQLILVLIFGQMFPSGGLGLKLTRHILRLVLYSM